MGNARRSSWRAARALNHRVSLQSQVFSVMIWRINSPWSQMRVDWDVSTLRRHCLAPTDFSDHCQQLLHFICVFLGNCSLVCMCIYDQSLFSASFLFYLAILLVFPFGVFLSVEYFVDHLIPSLLSSQNSCDFRLHVSKDSFCIQGLSPRFVLTCHS